MVKVGGQSREFRHALNPVHSTKKKGLRKSEGPVLMCFSMVYRFIEPKNSSLDLVFFILSSRNSIAAISSIGCSTELL